MKKFSILILLISISSCAKSEYEEIRSTFNFYKHSEIEVIDNLQQVKIIDGEKYVFQSKIIYDMFLERIDDEKTEIVIFELPSTETEFKKEGVGLVEINAMYREVGHSQYNIPINLGTIEGRKISEEEWQIEIEIETFDRERIEKKIKLSERFILIN